MSWILWLTVFGLTLGVFLLVITGMAVGVMLGRKRLTGSCGGIANQTSADGETSCSLCSSPDDACKDLVRRRKAANAAESGMQ